MRRDAVTPAAAEAANAAAMEADPEICDFNGRLVSTFRYVSPFPDSLISTSARVSSYLLTTGNDDTATF